MGSDRGSWGEILARERFVTSFRIDLAKLSREYWSKSHAENLSTGRRERWKYISTN